MKSLAERVKHVDNGDFGFYKDDVRTLVSQGKSLTAMRCYCTKICKFGGSWLTDDQGLLSYMRCFIRVRRHPVSLRHGVSCSRLPLNPYILTLQPEAHYLDFVLLPLIHLKQ